MHGNPAVDVFNGLKLAAGGELGVGVGEEEWGSGEREVLEGFIGRNEGLVDLVVSRFGSTTHPTDGQNNRRESELTLQDGDLHIENRGDYPQPPDGVVFSGIGALKRGSVKAVSSWMEWLHMYGKDAYGVRDNPSSTPRRKRRKAGTPQQTLPSQHSRSRENSNVTSEFHIPPSIVAGNRSSMSVIGGPVPNTDSIVKNEEQAGSNVVQDGSVTGTETLVKYLTLGVYGSTWGIPSGRPAVQRQVSNLHEGDNGQSQKPSHTTKKDTTSNGYFLIGLQGELEDNVRAGAKNPTTKLTKVTEDVSEERELNNRITMRSLHIERVIRHSTDANGISSKSIISEEAANYYHDRLRVVVYIQEPFIFTFLFELQTDVLAMPSFYRSVHHLLGPLQRPLSVSTSPTKVSKRLWEAAAPRSTASTSNTQPIWDLVYDPERLTVHTTIPNIPEPGLTSALGGASVPWTRIEALSVHSQILNTYISTRRHASELERTCKTSRGWWVVWMRVPPSRQEQDAKMATVVPREVLLVRKASDYVSPAARKSSGRFGTDVGGGSGSAGWSPGKLAEGIGIDARQYVEGLLSLVR